VGKSAVFLVKILGLRADNRMLVEFLDMVNHIIADKTMGIYFFVIMVFILHFVSNLEIGCLRNRIIYFTFWNMRYIMLLVIFNKL